MRRVDEDRWTATTRYRIEAGEAIGRIHDTLRYLELRSGALDACRDCDTRSALERSVQVAIQNYVQLGDRLLEVMRQPTLPSDGEVFSVLRGLGVLNEEQARASGELVDLKERLIYEYGAVTSYNAPAQVRNPVLREAAAALIRAFPSPPA